MSEYKIGKKIKKYREAAGLSQERLAEIVDVSTNFIAGIEQDIRMPSMENFIKITNAVNTSADLILSEAIKYSSKAQAADYVSRIEGLPPKDRQRIFAVLEILLSDS